MLDNKFTHEKYLAYLTEKYTSLNDNGTRAKELYDLAVSYLSKK